MPGLKERAKTLIELLDGAAFLFATRPLALEAKAQALLEQGGRARLAALSPSLAELTDWTAASLEAAVREAAERLAVKLGDLAQPLRAAMTGRTTSPGIFEVMEMLGRDESLGRLAGPGASRLKPGSVLTSRVDCYSVVHVAQTTDRPRRPSIAWSNVHRQ